VVTAMETGREAERLQETVQLRQIIRQAQVTVPLTAALPPVRQPVQVHPGNQQLPNSRADQVLPAHPLPITPRQTGEAQTVHHAA
jgi:hypothetical protein